MAGRVFNQQEYRFGYNTQERSDEIHSNHYTAEFWEYDSRVVKRWNQDPVQFPALSPYAINFNNPIVYSDPLRDVGGKYKSKKKANKLKKSGKYKSVTREKKDDGYWHVTAKIEDNNHVMTSDGEVNIKHDAYGNGKASNKSLGRNIEILLNDYSRYGPFADSYWERNDDKINTPLEHFGYQLGLFTADLLPAKNLASIAMGEDAITHEKYDEASDYVWAGLGAIPVGGIYIKFRRALPYIGKAKNFATRYAKVLALEDKLKPALEIANESIVIRAFEQHAMDYVNKVKGIVTDNKMNALNMKKYKSVYDDVGKTMKKELNEMYKELDLWLKTEGF